MKIKDFKATALLPFPNLTVLTGINILVGIEKWRAHVSHFFPFYRLFYCFGCLIVPLIIRFSILLDFKSVVLRSHAYNMTPHVWAGLLRIKETDEFSLFKSLFQELNVVMCRRIYRQSALVHLYYIVLYFFI